MRSCLALGKGREAVEAAERACRNRPEDPGLLANLGLALLIAGDVDESLSVTRRALGLAQDDAITRSLLRGIEDVKGGKVKPPERWAEDRVSPNTRPDGRARSAIPSPRFLGPKHADVESHRP